MNIMSVVCQVADNPPHTYTHAHTGLCSFYGCCCHAAVVRLLIEDLYSVITWLWLGNIEK
jgi:hypothetical protein